MRIRNGFVSNSSSSSYAIVGICEEINELKNALYKKNGEVYENYEIVDELDAIADSYDMTLSFVHNEDTIHIGSDYGDMGNDQTKFEFESEVIAQINKLYEILNMNKTIERDNISYEVFEVYN